MEPGREKKKEVARFSLSLSLSTMRRYSCLKIITRVIKDHVEITRKDIAGANRGRQIDPFFELRNCCFPFISVRAFYYRTLRDVYFTLY